MLLDDMTDVVGVTGNHSTEMLKMAFKLMKVTWYEGCSLRILWNCGILRSSSFFCLPVTLGVAKFGNYVSCEFCRAEFHVRSIRVYF